MPILKSEAEKFQTRLSKIHKWQMDIDRAIRQYEKNKDKSLQDAKIALSDDNRDKAKIFASNVLSLDSAIRGLRDYKLFLDNMELNMQFAKTTKEVWASLKQGSEDLIKSQLSEKQTIQMEQNIQKILTSSEEIQEKLTMQLDQISSAVYSKSVKASPDVEKLLNFISSEDKEKEKKVVSAEDEENRLDDLLKRISEK